MSGNNTRDEAAATTNASTSAGSTAARDPINGQPLATQQLQDRAITILENNQLMMRYAVANNLVSESGWIEDGEGLTRGIYPCRRIRRGQRAEQAILCMPAY